MPVNDLGYRKWEGELGSPYWRWLTIAFAGIKIVYKSQWIKRIMFVSWAPALLVGLVFFFYEQYVENRDKVAPDGLNEVIDEDIDRQRIEEAIKKAEQRMLERDIIQPVQQPGSKKASSGKIAPQNQPTGPEKKHELDIRGPDGRRPDNLSEEQEVNEQPGVDEEGKKREKGIRQYMRENRRYGGFEPMVGLFFVFASQEQIETLLKSFTKEPNEARGYVWSFILLQMLRRTQGWMVLILIGLITPPLISKDIRSRAFLFYFSKPISRTDYLLGKLAIVGFFVGFVTLLPALALYFFGVVLSPSFSVVLSTWDLPIKVIAACMITIIPACLIGLALSSMTSESRFAGFAWFMVWILGFVGYQIVSVIQRIGEDGELSNIDIDSYWRMVSLYDCLGYLQGWVMGLESNHGYALVLFAFVIAICATCVAIIMKNISAPMRA